MGTERLMHSWDWLALFAGSRKYPIAEQMPSKKIRDISCLLIVGGRFSGLMMGIYSSSKPEFKKKKTQSNKTDGK